jgi:hypothetical protein
VADGLPWDSWSEEDKERIRKVIRTADLAKHHRAAGARFPIKGSAEASAALAQRGGLSPAEALTLARFKQYEETTGRDPGWQGPVDMNTGDREEAPDADKLREAFFNADKKTKGEILAAEKRAAARSRERFYDDLIEPKRVSQAEALARSVKAKRKG